MPCPISPPAHPIRTSPRLRPLPLHAAADVAVAVVFVCAMAVASAGLSAGGDAYVWFAVISYGRTDILTTALMAAFFVLAKGGRLQPDAVVGGQQGAAGTLNVRTGHGDVRCLSRSGGVQAGFAAGVNPALLGTAKVAADFTTVLLLPATDADADFPDIFTPSGQVADTLDGLVALPCGIGCRHGTDSSVSALSCLPLCTAEWTCCARSVTGELNATVKPFYS